MTATTQPGPTTQDSPRHVIEAELKACNEVAKVLPEASPSKAIAHQRINQLLDWLVGR